MSDIWNTDLAYLLAEVFCGNTCENARRHHRQAMLEAYASNGGMYASSDGFPRYAREFSKDVLLQHLHASEYNK